MLKRDTTTTESSAPAPPARDAFGRRITYLRLSITDRCNLRCFYCMPPEGVPHKSHRDILRIEEYLDLVRAAAFLGVRKVRLTGGEPLVRRGVIRLVAGISEIPGIAQRAATTNGTLLPSLAAPLRRAGLQRVNVSLDSLRPAVYARITRRDALHDARAGIDAALAAGLDVTINTVLLPGINTDELPDLVRFARQHGTALRFIEKMPFQDKGPVFTAEEAIAQLRGHFDVLPMPPSPHHPHVTPVRCDDQVVGFITPMSHAFCDRCNKIRITPDGRVRMCLATPGSHDVRSVLRRPHTRSDLVAALRRAIESKPFSGMYDTAHGMWRIGG